MLYSLAVLLIGGMALGTLARKLRLPELTGYLLAGILLGPHALNQLDESLLAVSGDLRTIALIIILVRAGLNLNVEDLKKAGRPAVLMCFVPASFEILGVMILGPLFLGLSRMESLLLGSVLAAVSPAVVVPHMLKLMDEHYGTAQGVPQLILAGASADDIYVIVLFSCFVSLVQSGSFSLLTVCRIPTSILCGIVCGSLLGILVNKCFKKWKFNLASRVMAFMAISFLLYALEKKANGPIGFSGLLAVMTCGMAYRSRACDSQKIAGVFSKMWIPAQILLFSLVGAAVNLPYAMKSGIGVLVLIVLALVFRMAGVWLSVQGKTLTQKEKIFCMLAYTPKATVQAAIGGVPLALGLACGETVLTVSVWAILLTAPLGAVLIEKTYQKLLQKE